MWKKPEVSEINWLPGTGPGSGNFLTLKGYNNKG